MLVGSPWLAAEHADVNGFCPNGKDDRHIPRLGVAEC
jgi:hypothetical protein